MLQRIIYTLTLAAAIAFGANAQTRITGEHLDSLMSAICCHNTEWNTVALTGRMSSSKIPVTPSISIYMQRDRSIIISLRVFLLGEIGRMEVFDDKMTVINRIKKTYVELDVRSLPYDFSLSLPTIQDILLARPFLMNQGTMVPHHASQVDAWRTRSEDGYIITPKSQPEQYGFNYGFQTYDDARLYTIMVGTDSDASFTEVRYTYDPNGYDIAFMLTYNYKRADATLSLDEPRYGVDMPKSFSPDKSYRKTDFNSFMKSLKTL